MGKEREQKHTLHNDNDDDDDGDDANDYRKCTLRCRIGLYMYVSLQGTHIHGVCTQSVCAC